MSEIDSLEIKIQSEAEDALSTLDRLAEKLSKVSGVLSNMNVAKSFQGVQNVFQNMTSGAEKSVDRMDKYIQTASKDMAAKLGSAFDLDKAGIKNLESTTRTLAQSMSDSLSGKVSKNAYTENIDALGKELLESAGNVKEFDSEMQRFYQTLLATGKIKINPIDMTSEDWKDLDGALRGKLNYQAGTSLDTLMTEWRDQFRGIFDGLEKQFNLDSVNDQVQALNQVVKQCREGITIPVDKGMLSDAVWESVISESEKLRQNIENAQAVLQATGGTTEKVASGGSAASYYKGLEKLTSIDTGKLDNLSTSIATLSNSIQSLNGFTVNTAPILQAASALEQIGKMKLGSGKKISSAISGIMSATQNASSVQTTSQPISYFDKPQREFDTKPMLVELKMALKQYEEAMQTFSSMPNYAPTDIFINNIKDDIEQLEQFYPQASSTIDKFKDLYERAQQLSAEREGNSIIAPVEAEHLNGMDTSAEKAAKALTDLENRLSQLKIPEIRAESIEELESKLQKADANLEKLRIDLQNGIAMGHITESPDDSGYVRMQEKIALAEKEVASLESAIHELSRTTTIPETLGIAFRTMARTPLDAIKALGSALARLPKAAFNGLISGAKKLGNVLKSVGNALKSVGKWAGSKLTNGFKSLTKASDGMNFSLKGGFTTILKYGFGIRSIYVLFNKLRNAIKEGMNNLVQYSSETNASISLLSNSLNQLKNSTAAMISPLLNALAPALNQIIQLCIRAANAINQLISSFLGKSTWIKATELTEDYASSLDSAGKAAEDLKTHTLGIDELNVVEPDKSASSGGSGTGTAASDMFTDEPVSDKWKNIADWLKGMWESADFTALGTVLGEKLKSALESIPWDGIQETAAKIGKSFATLINGFVEVEGLGYTIGEGIGQAINTGIALANSFLDNTHWDSIGQFLAEGANGIVDTVDWEGIGHYFAAKWNAIFDVIGNFSGEDGFNFTEFGEKLSSAINTFVSDFSWEENGKSLGELAKGFLDTVIAFFEKTDWQELGRNVADFIGAVDWTGLFERLSEGIGAALGGLAGFLWGLIEDAWNDVVDWWYDVAYEDGEFTMEGLLEGIWEKVKDIATWIYEHIFQPFVDGFKSAFGISSPSTVMEEQGGYITEGMFNGIKSKWEELKGFIAELPDKILGFFDSLPEDILEVGSNLISGLIDGIKDAWENLKSGVSSVADGVIGFFKDAFDIHSPSKRTEEIGEYLVQGFNEAFVGTQVEGIGAFSESILGTLSNTLNYENFYNIGLNAVSGFNDGITNNTSVSIQTIGTWAEGFLDKIYLILNMKDYNSASGVFQKIGVNSIIGFNNGISNTAKATVQTITGFVQTAKNTLMPLVDNFREIGVQAMQGLLNGLSSMEGRLYAKAQAIADNIARTIRSALDIGSPSKVMFEIGDYTMQGFQLGMESLYKPIQNSLSQFGSNLEIASTPKYETMYGYGKTYAEPYESYYSESFGYQSQPDAQDYEETNSLLRELISAVREGKVIEVDGRELVSITDGRKARNGYLLLQN